MDFHEVVMKGKLQLENLNIGTASTGNMGRMVYYAGSLYYDTGSSWIELVSGNNFSEFFDDDSLDSYYTKTEADNRYLQISNFNTTFDARAVPTYLKKDYYLSSTNGMTFSSFTGYIIKAGEVYNLPLNPSNREWIHFAPYDDMTSDPATINMSSENFMGENISSLTVDKNVPFGLIYTSGWGWYFC